MTDEINESQSILQELCEKEILLLADVANGLILVDTVPDEDLPGVLAVEVRAAMSIRSVDRKWNVDGVNLMDTIEHMSPVMVRTLLIGIQQFWDDDGMASSPVEYILNMRE